SCSSCLSTAPLSSSSYPPSLHDALPILELDIQIPIVRLAVRRNLFRRDRHAIDHNLDEASSARDNFLRARTVQSDRVADEPIAVDRKSTRLNSSHGSISYAVFCLKKKKK